MRVAGDMEDANGVGGRGAEEDEEEPTSDIGLIGSSEDDNRVSEWEEGLPSGDDLMPLSHMLIPPELASAFSISPETCRSALDVARASQDTLATLRRSHGLSNFASGDRLKSVTPLRQDSLDESGNLNKEASESGKERKFDGEEADSTLNSADEQSARSLKRQRLVWTPQLHKRFVDVVAYLGIKNAVPKTIMQLMNVEGLTRENVASHLQKYRLYLKRMQGLSTEGPSSSDQLFASTPVPQSFHEGAVGGGSCGPIPFPTPYAAPQVMSMPLVSMPHGQGHLVQMPMVSNPVAGASNYHGFESHLYRFFREQDQKDWPGNNFGSIMPFPHMSRSDK